MTSQQPPDPYGQPPPAGSGPPGPPPGAGPPPPGAGPPPPEGGYAAGGYPPKTNGLAIASLVCSLAGLLVAVTAPVGAILGHVARRQIRERGEQGEGLALAGIIIGWIITGLLVLACCGIIGLIALSAAESA